ncbi:MAG TPA: glycosyltransferase [Verrucomicrobiae bacterium]|nr:glycosyltransferase [Verrucomicrobiae bacterium]
MKFSIVTPSFRSSNWLRLCIASVADQAGVEVEHIVQDSESDDGTQDWLRKDSRVKPFIEKDSGMYDAINRGFKRASGELLAYLNCDEQYLPGALKAVSDFFKNNPATDVLFADTLVVDAHGQFICCRKSLLPWKNVMWVYNPVISSSIFIHRRVLDEHGLFFDTKWRALGDKMWTIEFVRQRLKMAVLRRYTSLFTDTGENMALQPKAMAEAREIMGMAPAWVQRFRRPLLQAHRIRAVVHGLYWEKPLSYEAYTLANPERRVHFEVPKPTGIWRNRH